MARSKIVISLKKNTIPPIKSLFPNLLYRTFQCNLGPVGDLSIWEFSGHENYYMLYDHFIGNTNCIHTIVFNLEDPQDEQLTQIRFWLSFLQSRIPPVEPLGNNYIKHSFDFTHKGLVHKTY